MYIKIKEEDIKTHKGDIELFFEQHKIRTNIPLIELDVVQDDLNDQSNPLWHNRPTKQVIVE